MKGLAECHIPNNDYRTGWERIWGLQKRHQQICEEVAMRTPPAHETAVEYRDVIAETTVYHVVKPDWVEPEFELTAYDMMIQEGMERN